MDIRSFQGWRYDADGSDITRFIAPPYDILSRADKDSLLAGDGHNIVAVDLPQVPPNKVGPDEVYQKAAQRMAGWKSSRMLSQDAKAAIYAYQQTYSWAGKTHTRNMMICRVRATELGGDVIPHEKTFAGPKADRLRLTQYTGMQISPIFGFYNDPAGDVASTLQSQTVRQSDSTACLNGVDEKLWVVSDEDVIGSITEALRSEPVFIADGHHRYTTALNYRDSLGEIAPDHPANFVMFVLAAMDDPGLIILPTHRIVRGLKKGFSLDEFIASTGDVMEYKPLDIDISDAADADALLKPFGRHAMALVGGGRAFVARLRDVSIMADLVPDQNEAWRGLDVAILHKLLIEDRLASFWSDPATIDYTADGRIALLAADIQADSPADLAVLLQGTPIEAVREIALSGSVMPHKSTYFYPKLATGMVMYEVGSKCL